MFKSRQVLSHYDFIKAIALAWINRGNYTKQATKRKTNDNDTVKTRGASKRLQLGSSFSIASNDSKTPRVSDTSLNVNSGKLS